MTTENRLVAVISTIRTSETATAARRNQYLRIFAPATASKPTTITQKYQYSQPTENPAQPPSAVARVVGERAGRRVGGRHLAEHPHHQDDQHTGDRVGQERRRPGLVDHHAGADEQSGADHTADRDHVQLPLRQPWAQLRCATHGWPCSGSSPGRRCAAQGASMSVQAGRHHRPHRNVHPVVLQQWVEHLQLAL